MKGLLEHKRQNLLEKSRSLSVDIPGSELLKNDAGDRPQYVRAYNEFADVAGDVCLDVSGDRGALT